MNTKINNAAPLGRVSRLVSRLWRWAMPHPIWCYTPQQLLRLVREDWESVGTRAELEEIICHAEIHGAYKRSGFQKMTSRQKAIWMTIWDKAVARENVKDSSANVKGHASPEHAPKIDQTAPSASHVPACSHLPIYREVSASGKEPSWVVKTASLIADSDLAPGIDIVLSLENSESILNHLTVSLRVAGEADAPRIVEGCGMRYLASIKWGETQIMDGILLSFRRPEFLAELLVDLAAHMNALGESYLANV